MTDSLGPLVTVPVPSGHQISVFETIIYTHLTQNGRARAGKPLDSDGSLCARLSIWMARGRGVGPRPAPPHAPAHFKRVWGVLSLSVLLWLAAPAAAQTPAAAGNGKAASPAATLPAGKNITVPSHVRKHPDPAPLSIPEGSTLEDCIKHPGLCQPMACELWRDDIKDRCARGRAPRCPASRAGRREMSHP